MPKKIGFFHFGSDDKKMPHKSLEVAMEEAGGRPSLRESIMVLPEAFNIGVKYEKNRSDYDFNPDIVYDLMAIAAKFECSLVAGLIIKTSGVTNLPNSSAYFISSTRRQVLSLKTGEDDMAHDMYEPSTEVQDSPVVLDQTPVAALICMDADLQGQSGRERRRALREKVTELGGSCPILCVPANTKYYSTTRIAEDWTDFHFVLANGCSLPYATPQQAGYHPSVIWIKGAPPVVFQDKINKVIALPLGA